MRLVHRICFALILILISFLTVSSQTTGKKKYVPPTKVEEKKIEDKQVEEDNPQEPKAEEKKVDAKTDKEPSKIGYGVNLGNIAFAGNAFEFGLSPNIAYKLNEVLSIGFMLKLNYFYEKYPQYGLKYSAFDFGPTVFARWKPLTQIEGATPFMQGLFFQVEYERAYPARAVFDEFGNLVLNDNGTTIKTERVGEDYLYIGIGAASGYPFSTFFSFHYNIIDNIELSRSPFDYRIGFTYNY